MARVVGKTWEETKLKYQLEHENEEVSSISPFDELPSYCPFVSYVWDEDGEEKIKEASYVPPRKCDVEYYAKRFGTLQDGARTKSALSKVKDFASRRYVETCDRKLIQELLVDVGFESAFYTLLPRLSSKYLKRFVPREREWMAKTLSEKPGMFEFWRQLAAVAPFEMPKADPRMYWKKGEYAIPEVSCWRDASNDEAREFLRKAESNHFWTGLPHLTMEAGESMPGELVKRGIMLKWDNLAIFPEIVEKELKFADALNDLMLIDTPARDERFFMTLQEYLDDEDGDLFAPNETWRRHLQSQVGDREVRLLGDGAMSKHLVLDMAHKASLDDLAASQFLKITLIGDRNDTWTHYWRGGGSYYHDLCDAHSDEVVVWDTSEWELAVPYYGLLNRSAVSHPPTTSYPAERDYRHHLSSFDFLKAVERQKTVKFASSERDLTTLALPHFELSKDKRVLLLQRDDCGEVVRIEKEHADAKKKETIRPGGTTAAVIHLRSGASVDVAKEEVEQLSVCIAKHYPGPAKEKGTFYVGKSSTMQELLGCMKYCEKEYRLVVLPGASLGSIRFAEREETSFLKILRSAK